MPSVTSRGRVAPDAGANDVVVSSAHLPLWIAGDPGLFAGHGIVAKIRIVNDAIHAITADTPANRKPCASIAAMQNIQRLMALNEQRQRRCRADIRRRCTPVGIRSPSIASGRIT
jgi:hypothetical protein